VANTEIYSNSSNGHTKHGSQTAATRPVRYRPIPYLRRIIF